jgi:hypothetical protein
MPKPEPSAPIVDTVAPPRNFTLSIEDRLRAYAQGVPSYIRRRRRIEDLEAKLIAKIAGAPWRRRWCSPPRSRTTSGA